ncbi:hypothetical protein P7K49_008939, partial [Saguinus oedipus]
TLSFCRSSDFSTCVRRLHSNGNSVLECVDHWLAVPKVLSLTPAATHKERGGQRKGQKED